MKRSLHRGIFFYPMEVGHVSNKRIRLLLNDHGPVGYWIWHCLVDQAYKTEGYFHKVDADDIDIISADICRQPPEQVYRVIESCIKRGIFDKRVFEKHSALTNDRMQINYIKATYDRRRKGTPTYFYESHFLITVQQLAHIGKKNLENVLFVENEIPILSILGSSTEDNLFSSGKNKSAWEKTNSASEKELFSKQKNENENEIISNTIVLPASAASENGIIGLKPESNDSISGLAIKNGSATKKKVAPKKKVRNPDAEPHWPILIRTWVDFNLQHLHFKVKPIPKPDYSFMHRIIEKLRERGTDQGVPWTEQEAVVRWEKFLSTAYNSDKWLHDHFEMKNLTTQMQTIFNLVENGRTETNVAANGAAAHKSKLGTSDARMEANRKFGLAGKVFPSGHK